MSRIDIKVECNEIDEGWLCQVTVDPDSDPTHHKVTVPRDDYEELSTDNSSPKELIEESFQFLLEREPRQAILSSFEIRTIESYFPEYPRTIRKRLSS